MVLRHGTAGGALGCRAWRAPCEREESRRIDDNQPAEPLGVVVRIKRRHRSQHAECGFVEEAGVPAGSVDNDDPL